jgi:hypothetical protein
MQPVEADTTELQDVNARWREVIEQHDGKVLLSLLARGVRIERARELCHETWARLYEQFRNRRLSRIEMPGFAIAQATFLLAVEQRASSRRAEQPLELSPAVMMRAEAIVADSVRDLDGNR